MDIRSDAILDHINDQLSESLSSWYCTNNGGVYLAGMGLGIEKETKPLPFIVVDGHVYVNQAYIKDATITL